MKEQITINHEKCNNLVKELKNVMMEKKLNFLIGSGASAKSIGTTEKFNDVQELIEKVEDVSIKLLNNNFKDIEIKEDFDDYYNFLESLIKLVDSSNSRQVQKNINIFTTNYDLFIEKAIDLLTRNIQFLFNDGASGYFKRILDSSNYNKVISFKGLYDNFTNEIPTISLIKPHGSINWKKEYTNNEKINIVITTKVEKDSVIVKPNRREGEDTYLNDHFFDMLRVFEYELDKKQSALFVLGFSFKDNHICKMIKRALAHNQELIIYVFCYINENKYEILKNIFPNSRSFPTNFKILTPNDFPGLCSVTNKFDYCFVLKNLTFIINKE